MFRKFQECAPKLCTKSCDSCVMTRHILIDCLYQVAAFHSVVTVSLPGSKNYHISRKCALVMFFYMSLMELCICVKSCNKTEIYNLLQVVLDDDALRQSTTFNGANISRVFQNSGKMNTVLTAH